jgi:hypothetical protein
MHNSSARCSPLSECISRRCVENDIHTRSAGWRASRSRFMKSALLVRTQEILPLDGLHRAGLGMPRDEVVFQALLYVACTRARDHPIVTGVKPVSEFPEDPGRGEL